MQDSNKTLLIFTINGINSLLGWNAVLAALDYFNTSFLGYNIYSFLPVPLFAGYLTVGLAYHRLSNYFKYVSLIVIGNIIVNMSLAAILIVSITLKQELLGFVLLMFSSYLIGIGGNVSQLTFFAMINYLSHQVVSKFTVGTALSGLLITSVRLIFLASFGADNTSIIPIIIYFVIAIIFNTLDLFLNIYFCNSQVYQQKIAKFLIPENSNQLCNPSILNSFDNDEVLNTAKKQQTQDDHYFKTMYDISIAIFPYPFIIMLTFVITFILFPGPTLSKTFDNFNVSWSVIIFLISYNIGDTLGKTVAEFKNVFNTKSLNFVFAGRLVFFLTITIMANKTDVDDPLINNYVFPYLNQFLFAFTNGFCINASFIMAFMVCPEKYKKYAGVLCGLTLQIGIMLGTLLQIPYAYIAGISQ